MTIVTALDLVRPCWAPGVPDNDEARAPHVDVDDGTLGCALRCLGSLLRPSMDRSAADAAMDLMRQFMPTAPGETCPEVAMRYRRVGDWADLQVRENVGESDWQAAFDRMSDADVDASDGCSASYQLPLSAAQLLVAVWVAFSDRPRLVY